MTSTPLSMAASRDSRAASSCWAARSAWASSCCSFSEVARVAGRAVQASPSWSGGRRGCRSTPGRRQSPPSSLPLSLLLSPPCRLRACLGGRRGSEVGHGLEGILESLRFRDTGRDVGVRIAEHRQHEMVGASGAAEWAGHADRAAPRRRQRRRHGRPPRPALSDPRSPWQGRRRAWRCRRRAPLERVARRRVLRTSSRIARSCADSSPSAVAAPATTGSAWVARRSISARRWRMRSCW